MASHDDASPLQPLGSHDPRDQAGYRLLARIGEGGMGTVYLSHTRGGQPVALKVIRREYARDEEFRRRFQQEVQAARRVQGFHVVPVVDHDTTGDQPWLATSYVPGLPLDEALSRHGALPLPAVLQLVGCTAEALRAVHAAGVIHRDLKPSNILLAANGPWVIDFGIARAADSTQLTRSGGLIGTPQFMSPEHANGLDLTPATDLFSLGLIAAVAATGRHPYGAAGAITLATKIANSAMRPPDLSGYPDLLRPLLERCLAPEPDDRPSPAELAELCEQAAGRPLRDFAGWLPEAVAAEIGEREEAAAHPPAPEGAAGSGAGAGASADGAQGSRPTVPDAPPVAAPVAAPLAPPVVPPAPPVQPPSAGMAGGAPGAVHGSAPGGAPGAVPGPAPGGIPGGAAGPATGMVPGATGMVGGPSGMAPGTAAMGGASMPQPAPSPYGPGSFQPYPPGAMTGHQGPMPPLDRSDAADRAAAGPSGPVRKVLAIGGMVIALVLAVTLTYAFAHRGAGNSGNDAKGSSGGTGTASNAPQTTSPAAQPPATTDDGQQTGDPSASTAPTDAGTPHLLFQSRKFVLRSPSFNSGTHVDLDHATADPNGQIGDTDGFEIEYQDWAGESMRFLTTFGKSAGTSFEDCRNGVGADALPTEIYKSDLDKDKYFTKGSVLCTITGDGNLAMMQITGETPSDNTGMTAPMPSYTTLLTVWRLPDAQSASPGSG
ncbi:serine/threonine-protein kinase [Streptomyces sp. NPDC020917]|uniref:serine/threonine-protein kinase n=1 Tax=Streptomyces sp. NPDC020917 TaxID=3365102 RepID=UPI0037A0ED98